ncbi:E3 ubiquitin-protein ligase PDZRN3, partial [Stegodyphus mimosarum]
MIMKLTLHCRNSEHGCREKFTLEGCENHMKECIYEMVRCKNKPCRHECFRRDIADHELNGCLHRYVRCETCCMKISSVSPNSHDCIRDLKLLLKKKQVTIRKQNKKIKDLQHEIETLKGAEQGSSDVSSVGSLSAADIMISLADIRSVSSGSSADSDNFFPGAEYSGEDDNPGWSEEEVSVIINDTTAEDQATNSNIVASGEIEIEYPRTSSLPPSSVIEVDVLEPDNYAENFNESQQRRPAKRRHACAPLDSSDGEEDVSETNPSMRSPKRCWRFSDECAITPVASNSEINSVSSGQLNESTMIAGPSFRLSSSLDQTATSSAESPKSRFNFRSRNRQKPEGGSVKTLSSNNASAASNRHTAFERTIALLEQYNLESDPEWLPEYSSHGGNDTTSDSDDSSSIHCGKADASSDESFTLDSASSESDDGPATKDLLGRLYSTSEDDDFEWRPHGEEDEEDD